MKKQILTYCFLILILLLVSIVYGIVKIPFWYFNHNSVHRIAIDNSSDQITFCSPLTKDELMTVLSNEQLDTMNEIANQIPFSKVRETYQGYYAIIHSADNYWLLLFFNRFTLLTEKIPFPFFVSRMEAKDEINRWATLYDEADAFDKSTFLAYHALNTGAPYYVVYYNDGIDIVLFAAQQTNDDNSVNVAITKPLSYFSIKWNTINRVIYFDHFTEIKYIQKKDRSFFSR